MPRQQEEVVVVGDVVGVQVGDEDRVEPLELQPGPQALVTAERPQSTTYTCPSTTRAEEIPARSATTGGPACVPSSTKPSFASPIAWAVSETAAASRGPSAEAHPASPTSAAPPRPPRSSRRFSGTGGWLSVSDPDEAPHAMHTTATPPRISPLIS
ncbi:hypothetical protein [Saccharopolyspora rectivirgula]|uniref:hypothetical protein n=1 Tax=Saccharopolyspora rectivirgula TaxID=28042 RepID=UPI00240A459A|nr:hypothetical protein [Saccharopolyspora rectivirgula]